MPNLKIDWPLIKKEEQHFFVKRNNLDCAALLRGAAKNQTGTDLVEREVISEYKTWESIRDCELIKKRNFYPSEPRSMEEAQFPLSYVILVDGHLELLETLFNAIYAPQNFYCFHIDFRAHYMVHDFLNRFVKCFDRNHVFIADQSVPIAATSVSILYAQRACLLKLYTAAKKAGAKDWKYALTIDGHDFPLRTNREIVEILKLHDGGNDVELVEPLPYRYEKRHKAVTDEFGQSIDMEETTSAYIPPPLPNLKVYKGSIGSALSKRFVGFMLNSDVSIKVLGWLAKTYMPSEIFVSTLNHNDFLNFSGGYPGKCVENKKRKSWISRFTVWNTYKDFQCHGKWNQGNCIFGAHDLPMLDKRPELFAHEFDLQVSAAAVDCLHERLYNRTYLQKDALENLRRFEGFYENLAAVKYQKREKQGDKGVFECVTCDNCDH